MRKIKLVILSIMLLLALNLPPVGADSRPLTDQQLGILVGLAVDSHWVRQESASQSLVYGIVTPADQVPAGVSRDDSYLVARDGDAPTVVYYRLGASRFTSVIRQLASTICARLSSRCGSYGTAFSEPRLSAGRSTPWLANYKRSSVNRR